MLKKTTLVLFLAITIVTTIVPYVFGVFTSGSQKVGFPLRFFERSSAPPPFFGTTFWWRALLIDLLIYYCTAVGLVYLSEALKKLMR